MRTQSTGLGDPRRPALLAMVLFLGVGGCATSPPARVEEGRTAEAPNPIEVTLLRLTHTIHFAPRAITPSAAEVAGLNDFLASGDVARGDTILIEAATDPVDEGRVSALASALARQGLRSRMSSPAGPMVDEVHLVLERYVATASNCPNWSKAPGNDFANTLHSDFGCATAANLAAMVADPHDLVAGRPMDPPSGDPALAAMQRYRTGKITPLAGESATSYASPTTAGAPAGGPPR